MAPIMYLLQPLVTFIHKFSTGHSLALLILNSSIMLYACELRTYIPTPPTLEADGRSVKIIT